MLHSKMLKNSIIRYVGMEEPKNFTQCMELLILKIVVLGNIWTYYRQQLINGKKINATKQKLGNLLQYKQDFIVYLDLFQIQ